MNPMHYLNIYGWFDWHEIVADVCQRYNNCKFIEIGSFQGRSACYTAEYIKIHKKNIKLICVDAWPDKENLEKFESRGCGQGAESEIIKGLELSLYDTFIQNMTNAEVLDYIEPHRGFSNEVVEELKGEKYPCISVDACHYYEGVMSDLELYYPLVSDGGTIHGHDYYDQVERAVHDFFKPKGIPVERVGGSWRVRKP